MNKWLLLLISGACVWAPSSRASSPSSSLSGSASASGSWFSPSASGSHPSAAHSHGAAFEVRALHGSDASSSSSQRSHDDLETWCPTGARRAIAPYCHCEGARAFPILRCSNIEDGLYLRRLLQTNFPISRFGSLLIANSTIQNLDASVMPRDKQFAMITIRKTSLKTIDFDALLTSRSTLKRLEIIHNRLEKFPFGQLSAFSKLQNLDLYYNELSSIPDYAFGSNSYLKSIDLSFNKINHIGSYSFNNLPALERLDLRHNNLKIVNNYALASSLVSNKLLTVDLSNNKLFYIADGAFEGLIPKELLLDGNSLTKFPEKHFFPMLRAMASANLGKISVNGELAAVRR